MLYTTLHRIKSRFTCSIPNAFGKAYCFSMGNGTCKPVFMCAKYWVVVDWAENSLCSMVYGELSRHLLLCEFSEFLFTPLDSHTAGLVPVTCTRYMLHCSLRRGKRFLCSLVIYKEIWGSFVVSWETCCTPKECEYLSLSGLVGFCFSIVIQPLTSLSFINSPSPFEQNILQIISFRSEYPIHVK